MADPFREPQLSARQVRRILRRAAEIAEEDPDTSGVERTMSKAELVRAAADLGLPAGAVERASREDDSDDSRSPQPMTRSSFLGTPTHIVLEQEIIGEPSDSDCEDLLEDIREITGDTGAVERVGKTLVWKASASGGRGRQLSVRLRSRDGRTRVVVEERMTQLAVALYVGLGVGGGIGPMGGYIAAIVKLGAAGLVFPLLWIPMMLLLARTIFTAIGSRRSRTLIDIMERLKRNAERWPRAEARARVAAAASGANAATATEEVDDEGASEPQRARR